MTTQLTKRNYEEKLICPASGYKAVFWIITISLLMLAMIIVGSIFINDIEQLSSLKEKIGIVLLVTGIVYYSVPFIFLLVGFKIVNPNEALVLLLFGKYKGSVTKEGFYWVNPFATSYNPGMPSSDKIISGKVATSTSRKLSLKAMTLNNDKQKVNDEDGNPIEIGVIVIWKIVNTAKAVFNVDNYTQFVSTQADSSIRQVARQYPYDVSAGGDEKSLRGSTLEIAEALRSELQTKVEIAGIEILEAKIAHLAYAPEIAAAMLQRQQAGAIIAARQMIVEGAVGMVEMALNKLSDNKVCTLDEERKAAMVSNLLVVLCGNKDAQPIVNSGTIY